MELISYYLPQFHPIPENDVCWGPGFTEWTKVTSAKKLYPCHLQPRFPADLGYYDLRLAETAEHQSRLAIESGIKTFAYWYYWLGNGRRVLETPLDNMLANDNILSKFCLAWANESWTGIWHGNPDRIIAEQTYPFNDHRLHAETLAHYFSDQRYFLFESRPLFIVYKPFNLPEDYIINLKCSLLLLGFDPYIIAISPYIFDYSSNGFDGINLNRLSLLRQSSLVGNIERMIYGALNRTPLALPRIRRYSKVVESLNPSSLLLDPNVYPTVIPNWDNSPRSGRRSLVLHGSTPNRYKKHLESILKLLSTRRNPNKIAFIKSWNEWAEGNFLEPDQKYHHRYLAVTKQAYWKSINEN